jgi:hypothetical protein
MVLSQGFTLLCCLQSDVRTAAVNSQTKISRPQRDGGTMVAWDHVSRDDVLRAIQEYDRLGPERFFAEHGFGPSRNYELIWDERSYPHKAILGTAYEVATGQRLGSGDFEGGKAGAVRVLGKLGFTIEPLHRSAS